MSPRAFRTHQGPANAPQPDQASTSAQRPAVTIDGVSFGYGEHVVLHDVELTLSLGQFVAVVGPSGCGKSTLLLLVAGLLRPWQGEVRIGEVPVEGPGEDRAMVFQNFALLPWKTVLDNVALGLRYRRPELSRADQREAAQHYLGLVGLSGLERTYPGQLSGGMQQRVGLARAFAVEPQILLMDEPFGALDAQNAELMQAELRDLVGREARTVLFVTHDLDEALFLADRVAVMGSRPGHILEDVRVDLPHPRRSGDGHPQHSARYAAYRTRLWEHIRREVAAEHSLPRGGA